MYNVAGGELYDLKLAYVAASVLNPRLLKTITIERAKVMVGGLGFGFRAVIQEFIQALKNELERWRMQTTTGMVWKVHRRTTRSSRRKLRGREVCEKTTPPTAEKSATGLNLDMVDGALR
jgi:cation transport regulator ChaC